MSATFPHERATTAADVERAWAHYMGCAAIVDMERLAELLECRTDQVVGRVAWLLGREAWT